MINVLCEICQSWKRVFCGFCFFLHVSWRWVLNWTGELNRLCLRKVQRGRRCSGLMRPNLMRTPDSWLTHVFSLSLWLIRRQLIYNIITCWKSKEVWKLKLVWYKRRSPSLSLIRDSEAVCHVLLVLSLQKPGLMQRVCRLALPLWLLLLALLLLAFLLPLMDEGNSCSLSNNFARSFNIMLRYEGPPPT